MMFPSRSRAMPGPLPFPRSIGRRLALAVLAFLLLLVAVGSVSSYLAWSILSITQGIPLQSHHVEITEEIRSNVQRLIREIDRAVIHGSLDRESHLQDLAARTADMISAFLDGHLRDDEPFPEKRSEVALMRRVAALHAEVAAAMTIIMGQIRDLGPAGAHELTVLDRAAHELPEVTEELKAIHQARIQRLVDDGVARMNLILGAFAAFLVLGGACGAAGIRLFSRAVSTPLRALVSATQGIARGDLTKRVAPGSRDEIGWLSESFNEMAGALQQREAALRESQIELQQAGRRAGGVLLGPGVG